MSDRILCDGEIIRVDDYEAPAPYPTILLVGLHTVAFFLGLLAGTMV